MTAPAPGPAEAPDTVAAVLAPDLVAIVGHLVAQTGVAGQPAIAVGAQLAALERCHATLAGFRQETLARAAGPGAVPSWQSWASRLALALGELLGVPGTQTVSGAGSPGMTAWIILAEDERGNLTALGPVCTDTGVRALRELAEARGWTFRAPAPLVSKAELTRRAP